MSIFFRAYGSTFDTYAATPANTSYATVRAATTSTSANNAATSGTIGQGFSTPNYLIYQTFLRFDTSAAPTTGTVSVSLVFNGTAAIADFAEISEVTSTGSKIAGASLSSLTQLGSLSLTGTNLVRYSIALSGTPTINSALRYALYSQKERLNVAPTALEVASFFLADASGTTNDPSLDVLGGTGWDFVAAGTSVEATATSHILTEPAGAAAGDLLVACIGSRIASTTSITLPSGWALVAEQKTNNILSTTSAVASGMMAYIIRGGSAPSYTFTHPTAPSVALGRVVAYRNVNTSSPADTQTGFTTPTNTLAISGTGLTTTQDDDLIVAMAAGGQEGAWTNFGATDPATNSATTGNSVLDPIWGQWLERAEQTTGTGVDTGLGIFDAVKQTAGATGNLTASVSLGASHAIIAGAFKLVPAAPTGTTYDDDQDETLSAAEAVDMLLARSGPIAETVAAADTVAGEVGDPDALAWRAAVVTNGGTVSDPRFTIVEDFILAEKAAGTWALTDDYWGLWGEDAPQSLTSLKQRRLATAVTTPTYTVDRGYTFNGTSSYINTGFVQSTHQVAMSGGNLRIAVYQRDNIASNTATAGAAETASRGLWVRPRGTTNFMAGQADCTSVTSTGSSATSAGWSVASRTSTPGNLFQLWRNGAAVATPVPGTFTGTTITNSTYIGCYNNNGTAGLFAAGEIGFACIGAALTAAEELAQYNNVDAWAAAIGAGIPSTVEKEVAETAAAADAQSGTLVTDKVIAETATAVETLTGGVAFNVTVAETAAAADTVAKTLTYTGIVAESASAAETVGGLLVRVGAIAETASVAETFTALLTFTGAVAETTSAAETIVPDIIPAGGIYDKDQVEAAAAAETVAGLLTFTGAIAESASAAETITRTVSYTRAVAETASAADTVGGLMVRVGAVAESASAVDTPAGLLTFTAAIAEAASAAETITPIVVPAGGTLYEETVLETLAANDEVSADVIRASVGGGIGHGGGGGKRRRHLFIYENVPANDDDEEDEEPKPQPKRKLRLKKAEVEDKIEDAIAWIEAGSPRPLSQQALAAEVSAVLDIAALLEADRRRVERTIYRYVAALLAEQEEEEGVAMLLLAA